MLSRNRRLLASAPPSRSQPTLFHSLMSLSLRLLCQPSRSARKPTDGSAGGAFSAGVWTGRFLRARRIKTDTEFSINSLAIAV